MGPWVRISAGWYKPRGVLGVDDRRVFSGIIHVIRGGLMLRGATSAQGPPKSLYNRFIRRSSIGVFDRVFAALAGESAATNTVMIDVTHLAAHRTSASLLTRQLFAAASDALSAAEPELHVIRNGLNSAPSPSSTLEPAEIDRHPALRGLQLATGIGGRARRLLGVGVTGPEPTILDWKREIGFRPPMRGDIVSQG